MQNMLAAKLENNSNMHIGKEVPPSSELLWQSQSNPTEFPMQWYQWDISYGGGELGGWPRQAS